MKFKNIQIKGIGRLPGNMIENGYCDELINLRHKDGVLRAIGNKQVTGYNNPSGTWSYMWIHQMDTVTNLIGYNSSYELCKIETSGSYSVIKAYTSTQSDLRVVTMKRFLIALGTNTYDVFHWDGTTYNLVTIPQEPDIRFTFSTPEPNTDIAYHSTAEAVLGAYFDSVNTRDGNNFIRGSVMFRQAYKLYDGSYIFHTIPRLMTVMPDPVYDYVIDKNAATYRLITRFAKISRYIPDRTIYANLDPNIVQSVCIFASKVQDHFQIDEETITDSLLTGLSADTFLSDASVPKNPDYLTLSDAPSWYKVHEIDISAIQNLSAAYSEEIDMRGFYQDYGTRETLPVDNFSRQMITGYADFNYNSRLLLGKITTIFADPSILQSYYPPDGTYDTSPATKTDIPGYFRTTLKTDDGEKYVYTPATFTVYHISSYYIFLSGWGEQQYIRNSKYTMGCIGYPDARASKIEVLLYVSGTNYYKFGEFKLTKSKYDNYAYFNNTEFASLVLNNNYISGAMSEESIDTGTFTALKTFQDFNRVQASELSNPLVFPAENSYQVGTGSIIAICAASEPLSTGQFGEYPVHIFTTKGIYALNQGSGDVLFSTVTPASPEVANNRDNVISLGSGVVFTTIDGIYVIQGRQVKDIGKIMYGKPDTQLKNNAHLHRFLNGGNLPFFPDTKLSDINFQDYLSGSVIGYDKQNNELVISDDSKQYSYVYNFDSGFWSKVDIAYSVLINNYPELWGVTIAAKILNISVEYWDYPGTSTPAPVPIMFLTRPIKIDADGIFSLIHRTWLRCFVNTPSYLLTGIYVFGSNDMITWQFLTGMQREGQIHDMRLTRIHSKVKYFSVMFTAAMDRDSHIGNIELQYYNKLTNKIR